MFTPKTTQSIYERTITELKEVEKLNQKRQLTAESEMQFAKKRADAANDEVKKSRKAMEGFASVFGLNQ